MARGLICDRCGALITNNVSEMNMIKISPHFGFLGLSESQSKYFDLCKDCTKTVIQYINGDVQMVLFNDSKAESEVVDDK